MMEKGNMFVKYASDAVPVAASVKREDGYYPTITLGNEAAKKLRCVKVGGKVEMTLKGIVKSISDDEREGMRLVFEAHECECDDESSDVDDETAKKVAKMAMKKGMM